ncbi:MAG TPA: 3-deoxy-manno-octulosonate cytidylyltransferase [Steroidobacteraceae bacterium]|nr:3-deoxy-manno-octulosonate cytidylyltransferase [Steroidobacteraceae bacterium]
MSFKVVIPARYASTRLPGKPLLEIAGKPMVAWVVENACRSDAEEVVVATDDARIADAVVACANRASAVMTHVDHRSGTDRIAEVARAKRWSQDTVVVNVQGDEPQMPAQLINQVAGLLAAYKDADIATLCTPIHSLQEFLNTNVVKVVYADDATALYFSRAPIPWHRDCAPGGLATQTCFTHAQRHLGIYAYRAGALQRLTQMNPSVLELAESLEQLRAMQAGMRIVIAVAAVQPGQGVDTPEDIAKIRSAT